jgi:hypothetical protein
MGQTLTATATLNGGGVILYQWIRGDSEGISGANQSAYTLTSADVGKTIKVQVNRAGYLGDVISAATEAVADAPALSGFVSISGTAQVGQTLTAVTTSLDGQGPISYQWIRESADIPGATSPSYTLILADGGKSIKVQVRRTGNSGTITSTATSVAVPTLPTYDTVAALTDFLSSQTANSVGTPISVAYIGSEDLPSLYDALDTAGRFVALDLSGSATIDFASISTDSQPGRSKIVSLVLPDTLIMISEGSTYLATFEYFSNLQSVSGANVLNVGGAAFYGLTSLTTVNLPTANTINGKAFEGCTSLSSVSLPEARTIGVIAFSGCTNLKSISLPKASSIDGSAFQGCTSLTSVNLPVVSSIGDYAFKDCINLTSVDIPMVKTIGRGAFYGCTKLRSVNLPEASFIGEGAFSGCISLNKVILPKASSIGEYAFSDCSSLASIGLPKAISINSYAFSGCTSLTEVNLPAAMRFDGWEVFSGCTSLIEVNLPAAISIDYRTFKNCTSLTKVDLPKATSFGDGTFFGCYSLIEVNLPVAARFGDETFKDCTSLTKIDLPKATSFGSDTFLNCYSLTTVILDKVETFGNSTFDSCTNLETVNLSKATTFGSGTFSHIWATHITIILGATPPTIGTGAFENANTQTVTVKVPGANVGTYTTTWQDAFKGKGTEGSGTINTNISLTIEAL